MHRRISAHKVDRSASKSKLKLNSHWVLSSLMYFRSISTAPGVPDHFLGFFVADSGARDAFLFPCDDFSRGKVLFHISPSRAALVDTWFIIGLLAKCRHCCPPTVPNSVQTARIERRKYSQGLYSCGNLTVIHFDKSRPFNKGDPIPSVYKAKSWPS